MAVCKNCGKEIPDGLRRCPECGAAVEQEHLSDDVRDNRAITILSYIGPFALVPYFLAKRSPFARYHSIRGLNLFILEAAYALISVLLSNLLSRPFYLGLFIRIMVAAGSVFLMYVSVIGIMHVVRGQKRELPYLSKLKKFRIIKH